MGAENYNSNSANPSPDSDRTGPTGRQVKNFWTGSKGGVFWWTFHDFFIFHINQALEMCKLNNCGLPCCECVVTLPVGVLLGCYMRFTKLCLLVSGGGKTDGAWMHLGRGTHLTIEITFKVIF